MNLLFFEENMSRAARVLSRAQKDDQFCYEAITRTPEFTSEELLSIRRRVMIELNRPYLMRFVIKNPMRVLRYDY